MKIRVLDRILVFFAGIVLLFTGAGVIAERFFDVPVFDTLADMLFESLTVVIVAAAVLVLLGVYCVCMMFRRYKGKRGFVVQRTEGGELSISIKAIENLVQKCIDKHEELHVMSTGLENSRDGLVIKLRIGLASGVSIPLVVSALQKQIKQYITSCSGVDVHKVRVMVETDARAASDTDAQPVADAPIPTAAAPLAEGIEEPIFRHVEEAASYAVSDGEQPDGSRETEVQPDAVPDAPANEQEEDESAPDAPARREATAVESVEGEENA